MESFTRIQGIIGVYGLYFESLKSYLNRPEGIVNSSLYAAIASAIIIFFILNAAEMLCDTKKKSNEEDSF